MKIIRIVKTNKYALLYFLAALLYFQPGRYVLGDSLARAWNWGLLLVSLSCVALYGLWYRDHGLKRSDIGVLVLVGAHIYCLVLASFLNKEISDFRGGLIYAIMLVGFSAFARLGLNLNPEQFFKGYTAAGVLMCGIHLVTILLYQDSGGMRKGISVSLGRSYSDNWFFLGHANAAFFVVYPMIVMLFIYAYQFNRRMVKAAYAFLAFTLYCFFVQWTLAALLGCLAFCAFLLLDQLPAAYTIHLTKKLLNLRLIWIVALIGESFLALFAGLSKYTDFLLEVFQKGQSINARLEIWASVGEYILKKPLLGNGWNYETVMVSRITRSHTHNILIEYLYCGGLLAVFLFILAVEFLQGQIDQQGKSFYRNKAARIAIYALIPYVLAATFDYYMYRYHTLMLYFAIWYLLSVSPGPRDPEEACTEQEKFGAESTEI